MRGRRGLIHIMRLTGTLGGAGGAASGGAHAFRGANAATGAPLGALAAPGWCWTAGQRLASAAPPAGHASRAAASRSTGSGANNTGDPGGAAAAPPPRRRSPARGRKAASEDAGAAAPAAPGANPRAPRAGRGGGAGRATAPAPLLAAAVAERHALLRRWAAAYYSGDALVTDDVYDQYASELASMEGELAAAAAPRDAAVEALLAASPLRAVVRGGAGPAAWERGTLCCFGCGPGPGEPPQQSTPGGRLPMLRSTLLPRPQGAPVEASAAARKVAHPTPMLSLPAVQDADGLVAWAKRLARLGVDPEAAAFVTEPKVDGLAVRVVYR
jgi:hypothetical protein